MQNTFVKTDGNFARKLPTNLSEYYQSQGRTLPSVAERATAYGDQNYTGTAEQNTAQLQRLLNPAPAGTSTAPTSPTTPPAQQEQPVTDNPYDAFGMLLQEELKKAQTINTTDLLKQQRELQRQRIAQMQGTGGTQISDEERRFLSPEQQSSIRSSSVTPTEKAIDEIQYSIEEKNQIRKDLLEQILLAKDSADTARESALTEEFRKADLDFKQTQADADEKYRQATLAETIRSNKASEYLSGQKNDGTGSGVFGGAKLTTGQKNDMADMLVLQKQISALEKLKTPNGEYVGVTGGGIGTLKQFGATVTGWTSPEAQATRNAIGQIKGFIAKMRGGTSFTPNEQKLLDTYTPGINDSDAVIQSKLDSLKAYINDKIESTIMVSGGTYNPETPMKSIEDYRAEFPKATDDELKALMDEEQQ